ncbi:hypothetical protein GQX74_009837 [Glossina fuscipes]|nr:hypothetical protein GQX74_009837 [Glossina fuscipes]
MECKELNYCQLSALLQVTAVFPCVKSICDSSSCNSDFNSAILLLLFFTMVATSFNERRSLATSRNFSAPSFIFNSLRISRRIASLISSRRSGKALSDIQCDK